MWVSKKTSAPPIKARSYVFKFQDKMYSFLYISDLTDQSNQFFKLFTKITKSIKPDYAKGVRNL